MILSLKHINNKVTLVSNINIDTREAFTYLYFETFYSLYPNFFNIIGGMLFTRDFFAKHSSGTNSIKVWYDNKMEIKDEKWDGRNLLISSKSPFLDQVSLIYDKEWKIYEIFYGNIPYLEIESINEDKGNLEEGCSSKDETHG